MESKPLDLHSKHPESLGLGDTHTHSDSIKNKPNCFFLVIGLLFYFLFFIFSIFLGTSFPLNIDNTPEMRHRSPQISPC